MKITLLTVGKNSDREIKSLVDRYIKRLSHYTRFECRDVADVRVAKGSSVERQKELEGASLLSLMPQSSFVVLLDERGKEYTSRGFAEMIDKHQLRGTKEIIFVVGGPFGFSPDVYKRADAMMSLSQMTLTHEMIRLFFVEQVYRAFTIIKGESYHHD